MVHHSTETEPSPGVKPVTQPLSVARLLGLGLSTRFFIDTGIQIFMPFLPVIAAGLGVDIITMGRLVSLRSATGLMAPLFGVMADRRGYRTVMRLGLMLNAVGFLLIGLSVNLPMAVVGMLLTGMGTFAFLPSIQAYVSARLPYAIRGRGLGILEYAWALSGIGGLFLAGLLIAATSWRVPFYLLSLSMFFFWLLYLRLPAAVVRTPQPAPSSSATQAAARPSPIYRLRRFANLGAQHGSAWANVLAAGLIMFSAMHVMITYGAWLGAEYGLGASLLGRVALVLGVADLLASGLVSLFTDRLGKRRSVMTGVILALGGYLLLPFLNMSLLSALVGLLVVRFAFEFSIVSNFALLSEQVPAQRGKVLTLGVTGNLLGTTLAGITGPWAYAVWGVWGLGWPAAGAVAVALLVLWVWVREPEAREGD
ncbi:MAG: MFS transporter [Caldilineaceae bacterium]|nr:MFS transporter [Caldilineaceae bacterium]MBP8107594.1 MFS transporter [Caldilineaceae bacterium]MBP8125472.1 MFS transporter [Caldilineaceae bacterium]